ncbi:MAG: TetR/AcrR family transcriptional regulator [Hyphomonadaceae bacterium]|jgi:AcrR family transcriptional regulator|nr:TetR/AcrR family transcriptional regulator [Hyphomonadaceae bacterium]
MIELASTASTEVQRDGRELKGAAMRARLRAATEALIAEVGIEGATTVEVARRCEVSRGAMLHHYPTRDELIIDTARHFWQRARDNVSIFADDMRKGRAGAAEFVDRLYEEVFPAQSLVIMLELMVGGRSDTKIGRAIKEILTDLFRAYEELGEHAFGSRGLSSQRIHVVITLIVSALRGLRIQQIIDPNDAMSHAVRSTLVVAIEALLADDHWGGATLAKTRPSARSRKRRSKE